jgi:DNA-binding beta-propeller fold protein YncE
MAAGASLLAIERLNPPAVADMPTPSPLAENAAALQPQGDRSPVALALTADEQFLITANQTSGTLSLVHVPSGRVVDEIACGDRPSAVVLSPDGSTVLASATYSGDVVIYDLRRDKDDPNRGEGASLERRASVSLSFEPRGIAISPDGKLAYVALTSAAKVAVVDIEQATEIAEIDVGRWPRYLALSPDGERLAVGTSGDGGVSVVDTRARKMLFQETFVGLNLGHMQVAADGQKVYFPWVMYGESPINNLNIRRGWIIASRVGRVRLDKKARREAISLDPQGQAVGDPHGLALTPDESRLAVTASGTHELLVYLTEALHFEDYGGPGDHIDPDLLTDKDAFYRIRLGGRPMQVVAGRDGRHMFVANYLKNQVQIVDLDERRVSRTIELGGAADPSLARRGEAIFFDAERSLDGWYSCHSCHYEGGTNSVAMDTNNDNSVFTFKSVLSLPNLAETGPWTWHGWQSDLRDGLSKSLIDTMSGPEPSEDDLNAMEEFVRTLRLPPNPYTRTGEDGSQETANAARRGEVLFQSDRAGCTSCHSGPYFTDGQIHDVGLGGRGDFYKGFNTPSLLGVHRRVRLLHDGRARTLDEVLEGPHSPAEVIGAEPLTPRELTDLVAYLKTL